MVALQEIFRGDVPHDERADQVAFIARSLGYYFAFGQNRVFRGMPYGNATLSRLPILRRENYDITWHTYERRGCLRAPAQ